MNTLKLIAFGVSAALLATTAFADVIVDKGKPGGSVGPTDPSAGPAPTGNYYDWMSPGIVEAWNEKHDAQGNLTTGFGENNFGQDATISVVDDFAGAAGTIRGDLGDGGQTLVHGEWTSKQANMIAPLANMRAFDFGSSDAYTLSGVIPTFNLATGFNVINLSFRENEPITTDYALYNLETAIISAANDNLAFVAKSAGNGYGAAVGANRLDGGKDYLSLALIDGLADAPTDPKAATAYDSTIFVGAMDLNVFGDNKVGSSQMASYSNIAGADARVQRQFLVVGVESAGGRNSAGTSLPGTSFAAPIVAGYGAILSSKFTGATPVAVATQLLTTARKDSFGSNYNPAIHGQGEAAIALALAPDAIK